MDHLRFAAAALLPLAVFVGAGIFFSWWEAEENKAGAEAAQDMAAGFSWEDYGALPAGVNAATRDLERSTARMLRARQRQQ